MCSKYQFLWLGRELLSTEWRVDTLNRVVIMDGKWLYSDINPSLLYFPLFFFCYLFYHSSLLLWLFGYFFQFEVLVDLSLRTYIRWWRICWLYACDISQYQRIGFCFSSYSYKFLDECRSTYTFTFRICRLFDIYLYQVDVINLLKKLEDSNLEPSRWGQY